MKNFFKNKNMLIGVLLTIVFVMAIGFAGYAQNLQISDTASSTNTWNVYISNAELASNSPKATGTVTKAEGLEATFVTTLHSPGDTVVYNVTVKNDGNVDATLDEINLNTTNSDSVIKYSSSGIAKGDTLAQSESKTFTVTVEYDSTKTGTATEAQKSNSATLQLNFVQKTIGSGSTGGSSTVTVGGKQVALVTTGDGLYADAFETGRYIYRGAAPNNYIWLDLNGDSTKTDNETYRIVAVEADDTIKVVADTNIGNIVFDPGYSTAIDGVTSASSTTGTRYSRTSTDYCYRSSASSYYGCDVWGSKTTMLDASGNNITAMPREAGSTTTYTLPTNEAYLNTYLNTTFLNSIDTDLQSKIATHTYSVGPLAYNNSSLETDITQESAYKWKGKIGLINPTDYVRASTNTSCTNVYAYYNTSGCYSNSTTHNYLFNSTYEWTMNPCSSSLSSRVLGVRSYGDISDYNANSSTSGVAPVLYLKSDISLSGKGTSGEPYELSLISGQS